MRLGGPTGAPPASRSGHHDRSQPAPPAPMLRNGASGSGRSLRPSRFQAARNHIRRAQAHDRRSPRHPPVLRNGGWRGLRLAINNWTSTPLARLGTRLPAFNQHWRSTALPLRAVEHPTTIRTFAAQPARQANACHAGCFRSVHIERPTASRPRTRTTKPAPAEPPTPPGPLRSGAFTMQ